MSRSNVVRNQVSIEYTRKPTGYVVYGQRDIRSGMKSQKEKERGIIEIRKSKEGNNENK